VYSHPLSIEHGEHVDVISLYQLGEFLGAHVVRHRAQLQRATADV
jgi:hypothetical protein